MNPRDLPKRLYKEMLTIRLVEERIANEYKAGEMRCPTHLCTGQEAIAVGVSVHLTREDIVFSTHRSHGHYLAKDGNLNAMIAELYGKATGCSRGYGGSMRLLDLSVNFWGSSPIVANSIPLAVGAALAVQQKKENRIAVVYFGEAATEEGVFSESVNYAVLRKLPVLFVCENNFYSTNTPLSERQPNRQIYKIPRAFGAAALQGDGNDVFAVSQLAAKATSSIRNGNGPFFLEFLTYRSREHCGPNFDPESYRPKTETDYWAKRDPLLQFLQKNEKKKWISRPELANVKKNIEKELAYAFDYAKESPYPQELLTADFAYAS